MNANSIQGLHIELTNMCTLKCPGCARTRFQNQFPKYWQNKNLHHDKLFSFLDIDLNDKHIVLCGNYGDPIYHPEFLKIVETFKNQRAKLKIITNGSYKFAAWWKELCKLLDHNDCIVFSVDGIPDNFTQYRINGDWSSIEQAMKIVANSKCHSIWSYLIFAYNENTIEKAQMLSSSLGINQFEIAFSDRFDEQTEHYKPTNHENLGKRFNSQLEFKQGHKITVQPKCAGNKQHFITADGYYSPMLFSSRPQILLQN
jgi:Predicted Fe-S oxidoreductases